MSREIPWVYAEEIDWSVGDVWLVELKDEVVEEDKFVAAWVVVRVLEWDDEANGSVMYLCDIDDSDQMVPVDNVWRGLCLEQSETA